MLIECRQRRNARPQKVGRKDMDIGSKSTLFGTLYHFRPQPELVNGGSPLAHVCVVQDTRAIERFLSIAEAYNEFGKPPKVSLAVPKETFGQPETVTVLLDEDDMLGRSDSEPFVSDPLAQARILQTQWVESMLGKPVNDVVKAIPGLDTSELALLYAGELDNQRRAELLDVLKPESVQGTGEIPEIQME